MAPKPDEDGRFAGTDWILAPDEEGRYYYWNEASEESSYCKPEELGGRDTKGWVKMAGEDGIPYFFNEVSGANEWERPEEMGPEDMDDDEDDPIPALPDALPALPDALPPYDQPPPALEESPLAQERSRGMSMEAPAAPPPVQEGARVPEKKSKAAGLWKKAAVEHAPVAASGKAFDGDKWLNTLRSLPTLSDELKGDIWQNFNMLKEAESKFAVHKTGWMGTTKVKTQKLLKWTNEPINKPMLASSDAQSDLREMAIQTFATLMEYMGDKKTEMEPKILLRNILQRGMLTPELRDEIYAQVVRQTRKNGGKKNSRMKGWQVLALCCGQFPPSPEFQGFVSKYLLKVQKGSESMAHEEIDDFEKEDTKMERNVEKDAEAARFAQFCEVRLLETARRKEDEQLERKETPSTLEVDAVCDISPVNASVFLVDDTCKDFPIDSAVLVKQLSEMTVDKLKLLTEPMKEMMKEQNTTAVPYGKPYAFYKCIGPKESIMEENDFVMDVYSKIEQEHPNPTLVSGLRLRVRMFRPEWDDQIIDRSGSRGLRIGPLHLHYVQAVKMVGEGLYTYELKDAISLAALHCQVLHGDASSSSGQQVKKGFLAKSKQVKYISDVSMEMGDHNTIESSIRDEYKKLENTDRSEAEARYLEYARRCSLYGGFFYDVKTRNKDAQESEPDIKLVVLHDGIYVFDEASTETDSYWQGANYQGDWSAGDSPAWHGAGTVSWSSGPREGHSFKGTFKDGRRDGPGVYTRKEQYGSVTQDGIWKDGYRFFDFYALVHWGYTSQQFIFSDTDEEKGDVTKHTFHTNRGKEMALLCSDYVAELMKIEDEKDKDGGEAS